MDDDTIQRRRSEDLGLITRFYDWIDERNIDKHLLSLGIFYGTIKITAWAMHFADASSRAGLEVAAIIAAVGAPYMALQAAAISFYFSARK